MDNLFKRVSSTRIFKGGACCFDDGTCDELSESECISQGGTYNGYATSCATVNCEVALAPLSRSPSFATGCYAGNGKCGGAAHYRIAMEEVFQQLHSELPATREWGYDGIYPGPTIEAHQDSMVTVTWVNDIREFETGNLRTEHVLTVDTCIHGPHIKGQSPVTVVHLHGGKVSQDRDGYP